MARLKLSDDIYRDLRHKIITGVYPVNEKLPPERQLAIQYSTSRIPVRTAIQLLCQHGFLKTSPGSGSVVISQNTTVFDGEGEGDETSMSIPLDDAQILLESIRVRCVLEAEAARLAARNRTTEDIKKIQATLFDSVNEIRKLKLKESNSFFEADRLFHRAILLASKSSVLLNAMDSMPLLMLSHQYWSLKYTTPRDEVVSFHTQIYESILDENETKAYESMQRHLSRVETLLKRKAQGMDPFDKADDEESVSE